MRRKSTPRTVPIAWLFVAFCVGAIAMWVLQAVGPPRPAVIEAEVLKPDATEPLAAPGKRDSEVRLKQDATGTVRLKPDTTDTNTTVTNTAVATTGIAKNLRVPIDGIDVDSFQGGFVERRGNRAHEAVDILAARNTPVHAVADGSIAKLFVSKAGGNTIYQFDTSGRLCYYYAHLERYADGLQEGNPIKQGEVIGYVGTSGNAPVSTPHLHFAVFKLGDDRRWWQGEALDPYEVFRK